MRPEKTCPLPNTHNRLRQTHDLWHDVLAGYPDPDEFTTKLNACVQAARSVTFVLQKEHSKSDGFAEWYEPWRARLRADPLMRWLVDARNAIEKEGDLETASEAVVTLAMGAAEQKLRTLDVPPLLPPSLIAAAIDVGELEDSVRRDAVLIVTRRWSVMELPEYELLDVLGHCYGVLATIVGEAHGRLGVQMRTFGGEEHGGRGERATHPTRRLPCMVATQERLTAYWHLGLDSLMQYEISDTELRRDDPSLKAPASRYGPALASHRVHPGMPPVEQAEAMHHIGRRVLEIDRFHGTYAWLHRGSEPVAQLVLDPEDQQDKQVKARLLAAEVDRRGADTVYLVIEAWLATALPDEDPHASERPTDRADREEGLVTYLLQRRGPNMVFISTFTRGAGGAITLFDGDSQPLRGPTIFNPVLRVWRTWDAEARH